MYVVAEIPGGRPGGEVIVQCRQTVPGPEHADEQRDRANAELIVAAVNSYDEHHQLRLVGVTWAAAFEAMAIRLERESMRSSTRAYFKELLADAMLTAFVPAPEVSGA
jgi:predicted secreted protein